MGECFVRASLVLGLIVLSSMAGCSAGGGDGGGESPSGARASAAVNSPDWASHMKTCLAEAGWEVELTSDGGITAQNPPEQKEVYEDASAECSALWEAEYSSPPVTEEYARASYAADVIAYECLRDEGLMGPEPISEERYVEEYLTTGAPSWMAYFAFMDENLTLTWEEIQDLQARCPQPADQLDS